VPHAIPGSPPFSLTSADWKKIAVGAVLSMAGALVAFVSAEAMPALRDHIANDVGLLIYTTLAAVLPVVLNIARKWLGDTRIIGVLVFGGLCLGFSDPATAAEFTGATAAVIDGSFFTTLLKDPLMTAAILIGVCLLFSKVFNFDLSKFILPLISSLLAPRTPPATPTAPATPTVPVIPAQPDIATTLQLLLNMLLKARAAGDKEGEAAALMLLDKVRG
jgi:hypothetical protein